MTQTPAPACLAVGLAAFAASVLLCLQLTFNNPILSSHTDEWIYRAAGVVVRQHPADLYRALFGEPGAYKLQFNYPPFAALVFALGTSFSFGVWQTALIVIDVLLLPVILYASLRISRRRGLADAALAFALAAMALWLEPVFMTMFFGQINLILLALVIVDLALPDSSKWKGIGIGLAAGMKLTPLIFIPFLLASRRIRAGVVALLSFAVTVVIGVLVLPAASREFWIGNIAGRGGSPNLQNQSIDALVGRLLPGQPGPADALWLAVAVAVAVAGLATAALASRRGLELLGIVLCGLTGLLISPTSWTHHWVWAVVPGLALMAAGAGHGTAGVRDVAPVRPQDRIARAAGAVGLLILFAMWPRPGRVNHVIAWLPEGFLRFTPHGHGLEYTWHGGLLLTGNLYVITGVAVIVAAAGYLWATWPRHNSGAAGKGVHPDRG
jgi:alpha-1,2-mannosyltransferase